MKTIRIAEPIVNVIIARLEAVNGHSCTCSGCAYEDEQAKMTIKELRKYLAEAEDR